jgi:hypothetical protein
VSDRRKLPAIPEPQPTLEDLYNTVMAIKQLVEILTGQAAKLDLAAVTWDDLTKIEPVPVITPEQIPKP